ncbi:corrinoid protein [bacterium]|nr:corrinoid protein [bacterium]
MELLDRISAALQQGNDAAVLQYTGNAIEAGIPASDILNRGLIAGMDVIGLKFKNQEIFLPDVLLAARAMNAGMGELKPLLMKAGVKAKGKVVLGTVAGDLHDIGKNLVGIMLKGAGYEVIDLGTDVPAERFIDTAVTEDAPVIGMSALLTTTMPSMRDVTALLAGRGLNTRIKTVVGGAPLSARTAAELGADYYAGDAATAVDIVNTILS